MAVRNFPTFAWKCFEDHRDAIAFTVSTDDGVESVTYAQWTRDVQRLAAGLMDAGFESGTRLGIAAPTRREVLDLAMACWLLGGCVVSVPSGRTRRETLRKLARAGCDWIAAENEHALSELRGQGANLPPTLQWIAMDAVRTPWPDGTLHDVVGLRQQGKERLKRGDLQKLAKRTYELEPSVPAVVVYDFAESEDPKGAYFTGGRLALMLEALGTDLQLEDDDRLAPVISFGWFVGFFVAMAALTRGGHIMLSDSASALQDALPALQPTILLCGPAFIEGQAMQWRERIERAPDFLKDPAAASGTFMLGGALNRLGERAAQKVVYKPLRESLGGKVRRLLLVGGKAPDDVIDVMDAVGMPVLGIWGLPEAGVTHLERLGATRPGSVGRPVLGVACKIDGAKGEEPGEILIRSDSLFDGYWGEDGARNIEDGWLRTGVTGHIASGYLFIS